MRGKAIEDRKKSQRFSKAVTEIIAAARSEPDRVPYTSSLIQTLPTEGGKDPTSNHGLAVALRNARALDVPKDNILAAIAKASGPVQAEDQLTSNTYEALGPGSFPLIMYGQSEPCEMSLTNSAAVKHYQTTRHGHPRT